MENRLARFEANEFGNEGFEAKYGLLNEIGLREVAV
jgi:hypothetical protein